MKIKQICVKKKTSADGKETELQKFQDLFPSEKDCLTPPLSKKPQFLLSTVVVASISRFARRLFFLIL